MEWKLCSFIWRLLLPLSGGFVLVNGLECLWAVTSGMKIIPYIQPSGVEISDVATLEHCQTLCVSRSEFLCHSINYNVGDQTCVLMAENLQTANQTSEIGWTSAERPACQGVWLPWRAERLTQLSGSDKISEVSDSQSRTKKCTAICHRYYNCRSITLEIEGSKCQLWRTREGDKGVELQQSNQWQTFNAPLWYLDDSTAATGTKGDVKNLGAYGSSAQMFTYLTVPVDGYLIGWKYYNVRGKEDACISYADIWRTTTQDGRSHWQLVSQTRLKPENLSVGTRFQYVMDLVHVRAQDFVGTHVDLSQVLNSGKMLGCQGNRVSFSLSGLVTPVVLAQAIKQLGIQNLTAGQQIQTTGSHIVTKVSRTPAMKAYIVAYINFTSAPSIQQNGRVIQISWEVEDQPETLPVAGYRLSCSNRSDFSSITACPAPASNLITTKHVTFTAPASTQPVYTRVQVIRNINGREEPDLTYSSTSMYFSDNKEPVWSVTTNALSKVRHSTMEMILPESLSGFAKEYYRFVQVKVEKGSGFSVSSSYIAAELNLMDYGLQTFTIGDGREYGGNLNKPLSLGYYRVSVGYRSVDQNEVDHFYIVPGMENVKINDNVLPAYQGEIIGGSVVGVCFFLLVVIVVVVIIVRRRRADNNQFTSGSRPASDTNHQQCIDINNIEKSDEEIELEELYELMDNDPEVLQKVQNAESSTTQSESSEQYLEPIRGNTEATEQGDYENAELVDSLHLDHD